MKKSIRGLSPKVVRRISFFYPQLLHILSITQLYLSTLDDVEGAYLPSVHWSRIFQQAREGVPQRLLTFSESVLANWPAEMMLLVSWFWSVTITSLRWTGVRVSGRSNAPWSRKPTFLQQERWKTVQQAKLQGISIRGMARELGIHRETVRRYIDAESPPTRRTPPTPPAPASDTIAD